MDDILDPMKKHGVCRIGPTWQAVPGSVSGLHCMEQGQTTGGDIENKSYHIFLWMWNTNEKCGRETKRLEWILLPELTVSRTGYGRTSTC